MLDTDELLDTTEERILELLLITEELDRTDELLLCNELLLRNELLLIDERLETEELDTSELLLALLPFTIP